MLHSTLRIVGFLLAFAVFAGAFTYSTPPRNDPVERVRAFTRDIEFNFIDWTVDAAWVKVMAGTAGLPHSLGASSQRQVVAQYLAVTRDLFDTRYAIEAIFADPAVADKEAASSELRSRLSVLSRRQQALAPLAESILQGQIGAVLADLRLTSLGQPLPGVMYHTTPLPDALIVSPRDRIIQSANVSLVGDLTTEQQVELEGRIDAGLGVSSLVVPVGGIGIYPTMVMESTDLPWLLNTIAHEWIHNYLTLRPLGLLYAESPELRTMNETTASIAGDEIGAQVLKRFYPELSSRAPRGPGLITLPFDHPEPGDFLRPPFDFRAEMHETRVATDRMLAEGRIEEAEAYMEARRLTFLKHGYLIRKLNQAYFAFYGAYADTPGGAAGEDPVGPAVRALRARSESLADFINTMAWMTGFEDLQRAVDP